MNRESIPRACLLGTLLTVLVLTGCAQLLGGKATIRQKRRFTIVAEPIRYAVTGSQRPYPVTVQLRTFDIPDHYNQLEIISRSSPYELRRDRLHVWALRPREMITEVVAEYLRKAQLFSRLSTDRDLLTDRPDYVLTGSIRALERFDSGDRWFARLLLSMQLVRQEDGQVLWQDDITRADEIEVFNPDVEYTVQALSEILRRAMESFVRQLDGLFLRMSSSPQGGPIAIAPADTTGLKGASALATPTDTTETSPPDYYEIIPGKLAP